MWRAPSAQECVYQDYGLAKEVGWEPGDYQQLPAAGPTTAQAGKAAGDGPSGVSTTRHPEGSGGASGASGHGA